MATCPVCHGTGQFESTEKDPQIKEKIQHLLSHGVSYQKIAEVVGLHKSTVGYYIKRYKLSSFRKDLITNPASIDALAESGADI